MAERNELKGWSKNDLIREVEKLRAILYEHAEDAGTEPTAQPGTMVDVAGDPYARGGVVFDMRNAVLLESVDVAIVDTVRKDQPIGENPVLTMTLEGRVNKRTERAETLYVFDVDGAAAIVSQLFGLSVRIGPEFATLLQERLAALP